VTGQRLENAYVKLLRYYPEMDNESMNAYLTVEVGKTDSNGQTGLKGVLADVWYKFIIEYPANTIVYNGDIQKLLTDNVEIPVSNAVETKAVKAPKTESKTEVKPEIKSEEIPF
jgi:hypothetical protein